MDILIKKTRISSRANKDQIGDQFRTDEKKGIKRAALEWDDLVLQEQLKYLTYVDRSSREDLKTKKLIDELNFRNCMRLNRKKKSKFSVGTTYKKR